jgi:hypothetical protein
MLGEITTWLWKGSKNAEKLTNIKLFVYWIEAILLIGVDIVESASIGFNY